MDRETLAQYGIDYDRGLTNCMGSETFYRKILAMFRKDPCFSAAEAAYRGGNRKELFSRMHELKGTSGNAALRALYDAAVPLVELLRVPDAAPEDELARLFTAAQTAYRRACAGIDAFLAEP